MTRIGSHTIHAAAALEALCIEPNWADIDPGANRALIVDLRHDGFVGDLPRVVDWFARQVVPVIGIGSEDDSPLAPLVDVLVEDESALEGIIAKCDANPEAAAVLVQVLRNIGHLGIAAGLALESMAYATLQGGSEFARWLAQWRARGRSPKVDASADVLLIHREGTRVDLVLDSAVTRNSLSVAMRDALTNAFKLIAMDASVEQVHVSANGPSFSAGGDLDEFGSLTDVAAAHHVRMLRMPARYLALCADRCHFHVHGACIGAGIEIPSFAARITATPDAFFQLPEVAMGLIPGAGGCVGIPRRIGRQRAAYMALSGERIDAERALAWGLVDAIEDRRAVA